MRIQATWLELDTYIAAYFVGWRVNRSDKTYKDGDIEERSSKYDEVVHVRAC